MIDSQIEYAGFWRRFAAMMIDQMMLGISAVVLIISFGYWGLIIAVFGAITYDIGSHYRFGATIGQRLLGIRVVNVIGRQPSLAQNTARFFAHFLSALPLYYGFFRSLWDDHRQAWHDELTKTYVIRSNTFGLEKILTNQRGWPLARPFKLPRLSSVMYFGAGVIVVSFLSQLWLKASDACEVARDAIITDAVVTELCGGNLTSTFRYGNPFSVFTEIGIGNIYFNAVGDSGSTLARAHVYSYNGNQGSWVEIDKFGMGYVLSTTVGRPLCFQLARKGTVLLNRSDSLEAYRLFRRAMTINWDYTHALDSRKYLKDDTAYATMQRDWSSQELASQQGFMVIEDTAWKDVAEEVSLSYLIRSRLIRGYCYQVLGDPSKALIDYDSLLEVFPWLFTVYLDKSSSFLQMGNVDSAAFYLNAYFTVEPDTNSQEFDHARLIRNRLFSPKKAN